MINDIQEGGSGFDGHFLEQRIIPVKLWDVKLVVDVCCLFWRSVLWVGITECSNEGWVPKLVCAFVKG